MLGALAEGLEQDGDDGLVEVGADRQILVVCLVIGSFLHFSAGWATLKQKGKLLEKETVTKKEREEGVNLN